jgi:1-acyl-sn-glycerol-3-phosphate acyltransferase
MTALFSILYWIFFAITSIFLFMGALAIWAVTAPFDRTRKWLNFYTCWWAQIYLRCLPGCRIQIEGREKIAPRTAYVLVANHQSMTDVMALSALRVLCKWVGKKEAFRIPVIGWNMYLNGTIKVDRGRILNVNRTMEICRRWLRAGVPLMIFPEGHRSPTGEMIKFHGGAFKLAAECGCPVVPIVVDGTWPIYSGWKVKAFPGLITVRVLDPVTLSEAGGSVLRFRDLVFERMKETLAEIRATKMPPPMSPPVPRTTQAVTQPHWTGQN